jgi:choice-of-anchor A domain-containing protein
MARSYSNGGRCRRGCGRRLVVQGSLTYINGQVFRGSVIHQGAFLGSGVGVPNGTVTQAAVGSVVDFAAASSYLTTASTYWGGLAPNSTVTNLGVLQLSGSDPGVNIFRITAAALASAAGIVVTAPSGSTVLVNVDGTSVQFQNMGVTINGTTRQNVLFNFYQANSLTIQGVSVEGSVLAPFAALDFNNGMVSGNVIAGSVSGKG